MTNIKEFIYQKLEEQPGEWEEIAKNTGISIHMIIKYGRRKIHNPGINHMQTLLNYFKKVA